MLKPTSNRCSDNNFTHNALEILWTRSLDANMFTNSHRNIWFGKQFARVAFAPHPTSFMELWRARNTSRNVWKKDFCLFIDSMLHCLCSGRISLWSITVVLQFHGSEQKKSPLSRNTSIHQTRQNFAQSSATGLFWKESYKKDLQQQQTSSRSRKKWLELSKRSTRK